MPSFYPKRARVVLRATWPNGDWHEYDFTTRAEAERFLNSRAAAGYTDVTWTIKEVKR